MLTLGMDWIAEWYKTLGHSETSFPAKFLHDTFFLGGEEMDEDEAWSLRLVKRYIL